MDPYALLAHNYHTIYEDNISINIERNDFRKRQGVTARKRRISLFLVHGTLLKHHGPYLGAIQLFVYHQEDKCILLYYISTPVNLFGY